MKNKSKENGREKLAKIIKVIATVGLVFVQCSDGLCQLCSTTKIGSFDDLLVREYAVWSRNVSSRVVCLVMCHDDQRCVNFQYNENTGECGALASRFLSPPGVDVKSKTGFILYALCAAANRYRGTCTFGSDCAVTNTDCINGTCQCKPGRVLSHETHLCVKPYVGCYEDGNERMLPYGIYLTHDMTLEICHDLCRTTGYIYFGTQATNWCHCSDTLTKGGYSKVDDSECNQQCIGNHSQMCGGSYRNSVYLTGVY